jgi:hypothetical protein
LTNAIAPTWKAVARETFEYNMRPWMGRRYERWLRDSVRPHPIDQRGQVLVPQRIYDVFQNRRIFARITAAELAAASYPKVPRDPVPPLEAPTVDVQPMQHAVPSRTSSAAILQSVAA